MTFSSPEPRTRVRAGPWNAQRSTKTSDDIEGERALTSYLKDSIYLAIIAFLITLLVRALFTPFPTADGATTSHCVAPQWKQFAIHQPVQSMVENSSNFDTDSRLHPDTLDDVSNAIPTWCMTAAGLSPITGDLNGTAPDILVGRSQAERLTSESASAANSTEPAN